jgi:hypothetical protein
MEQAASPPRATLSKRWAELATHRCPERLLFRQPLTCRATSRNATSTGRATKSLARRGLCLMRYDLSKSINEEGERSILKIIYLVRHLSTIHLMVAWTAA